jgi:Secretion system C-terminal sorting domain
MIKNSTFSIKVLSLTLIALLCIFFTQAQSIPKLKFSKPQLVAGVAGSVGATYKFSNVTSGVDAFIMIEDINNGAILVNIDDSVVGYYDAWQPTVGGPNVAGSSYIKWNIDFKTTAGAVYTFATVDAAAIDVDGDNAYISEFVGVNGQASYDVPTLIPTLLTIKSLPDTDNVNHDDPSPTNLWAFGPVTNRTDIDTSSQDVRINYNFQNTSKIKFYTGSTVAAPGGALNRYHSIYFMDIKNQVFNLLPVTYRSFDAALNNHTVNLSWTTDAAMTNDHFEIERSFDQKNFTTVGIVLDAQSKNGVTSQYSFKDDATTFQDQPVIYYRLKQVDVNGQFSYSVVKVIKVNTISKVSVQVSPNPYMDKLNVNFISDAAGNAEVRLVSATGNLVKITSANITKGYNNIQLQNLQGETAGIYIASVVLNGKMAVSVKVVKQ